MSNTSKNAVSNGLVGSTVTIGTGTSSPTYGAIPSKISIGTAGGSGAIGSTSGHVYTTNGTSGQFLTSTGSNGTAWTTGPSTIQNEVLKINQTNPPELEVKGRLVLNGLDVEERLKTIERVLTIPERDVKLEAKHPKLKKLYDDYINALGKYRTFQAIKGED
jgi:hypothetical protein